MIIKSLACSLSAAMVFLVLFSPLAEARGRGGGHHGGRHNHRPCRMHSHRDFGTNMCVRNHY